jgi:mannosyltransferase OCH1-like enzyme
MNNHIPNNIILTWKDLSFPYYIIKNIENLNKDKNIRIFTDHDIKNFLTLEYGSEYVDYFNRIKHGYNKGDFFRYCYLYKYGGYYCDIDIEHILPISEYIQKNTKFFTIMSCLSGGHIFQALLFTEPNHQIIKDCIDDMFKFGPNPPITPEYTGHTTTCMFNNLKKYIENNKAIKMNDTLQIGREITHKGRHVCIYNNIPIAFSRYTNYTRDAGFKV